MQQQSQMAQSRDTSLGFQREQDPSATVVRVTFKVNYKTQYGECLSLVGDTHQTGQWRDFSKNLMEWSDGDWWEISLDVDLDGPFLYKYVVIDYTTRQAIRWEQGRNRICDPQYLDTSSSTGAS